MNFDKKLVERVRQQYPEGTRIRLESLCNEERDMPPGLCGTVIGVDDQPTLLMKWDNDKSLSTSSCSKNCSRSKRDTKEDFAPCRSTRC